MTPILPKPEAILFDWDNTLVNTWPLIHRALNIAQTHFGLRPWALEEVQAKAKKSMRESFGELFGEHAKEAGEIYQKSYRDMHQDIPPIEGAKETLQRVKEAGIFCAAVSNKQAPSLREEIHFLGWSDLFHKAVGAGDAARDKPSPDPALLALEASGVKAHNGQVIWFVGDTGVDLECAHHIGAVPILYGNLHEPEAGMHDGFAFDAHAKTHDDMLKLLEKAGL